MTQINADGRSYDELADRSLAVLIPIALEPHLKITYGMLIALLRKPGEPPINRRGIGHVLTLLATKHKDDPARYLVGLVVNKATGEVSSRYYDVAAKTDLPMDPAECRNKARSWAASAHGWTPPA